ncbi:MAG TPA: hypothetical protein DDZ66_04340 [Firmicutes bacterium]|jgi:hypothetical protein|nr:hypothetical protein [Bacillota bacterium]
MKSRIIGVDIDGVISFEGDSPENNIWHNALCDFLGENVARNNKTYDMSEAYGLSEEVLSCFLEEKLPYIYEHVEPQPYVRETLQRLIESGFEIVLITARDEKYRQMTTEWLAKHKIPYSDLIHEVDKPPVAKNKDVELFVEDYAENAISLIESNIPVVLINSYHNQWVEARSGLYRADNWLDVELIIEENFGKEVSP